MSNSTKEIISMTSEAIMARLNGVAELNRLCAMLGNSTPVTKEEPAQFKTDKSSTEFHSVNEAPAANE